MCVLMRRRAITVCGLASVVLLSAQCVAPVTGETQARTEESRVADTSIIAAQEALTDSVIGLPGVAGTAVGLCADEPCIKVYLGSPSAELMARIPESYRGFKVDVEVTGEIRARGDTLR